MVQVWLASVGKLKIFILLLLQL